MNFAVRGRVSQRKTEATPEEAVGSCTGKSARRTLAGKRDGAICPLRPVLRAWVFLVWTDFARGKTTLLCPDIAGTLNRGLRTGEAEGRTERRRDRDDNQNPPLPFFPRWSVARYCPTLRWVNVYGADSCVAISRERRAFRRDA